MRERSLAMIGLIVVVLTALVLLMPLFARPASVHELSPEQFRTEMEARLARGDLSCDRFTPLQREACGIYQDAKAMAPVSACGATSKGPLSCYYTRFGQAALAKVPSDDFDFFYAIEALNYVPLQASSARYRLAYMLHGAAMDKPQSDPEAILKDGYGACGQHSALFIALLKTVGIQARTVQMYYMAEGRRNSHITAEALIGGKWRYFDTSFAGFFLKDAKDVFSIASFEEVRKNKHLTRISNEMLPWKYWSRQLGVDFFDYLNQDLSVVYSQDTGSVFVHDIDAEKGEIALHDLPGYIGDNVNNGPFTGVSLRFAPLRGVEHFHFDIRRVQDCDASARLCVNEECVPLRKDMQSADITAGNARAIHIESTAPECYVTLDAIHFSRP